jgi:adenylate cyclase class IV
MAHFEIEIKSLLGSQENADTVKEKMKVLDPDMTLISTNSQLNHYFEGGDITKLFEATKHFFTDEVLQKFEIISAKGTNFSVRTRQRDADVLLVIKVSIDDSTSQNGVLRMEFEEPVPVTLDELDGILLQAGYTYQAKWSREREEYAYKNIVVCFDKNAGYGYLAEFEKVIHDENEVAETRRLLDAIMNELGVIELDQERLSRMFEHYNTNWPEYYGTDKTFTIE